MKGRTGSTLSRTKYVKCFRVETSCYRVVLRLKFIVTVELLYDQAESDFVQCQTKIRAFASSTELDWNRIVRQNALWSLVFSTTQPERNKSPRRMQVSLQPGTMTGRGSETFEDLLCLFSSEDKYKDFPYIKEKIDWSIGMNYSSVILNGLRSFFVASRLIAEVNEYFQKYGSYRISLNQRMSLWYGWELGWIELGFVRRPTSQEMK